MGSDKTTMERDIVNGGGQSSPDQDAMIEVSAPTLDEDNISTLSYLINLQDTKLEHAHTPTEPVIFNIAMQRAVAFPVPIRRKKAETKLIGRSKVGSANSDTGPESDFTGNGCTSDWEWSRARS